MPAVNLVALLRHLASVRREPGGGIYIPLMRRLYDSHKASGGAYRMMNLGFGRMVVATSPLEFVKVLQKDGKYPAGLSTVFGEPIEKYMPKFWKTVPGVEIFGRGEVWATHRKFLNTGLLAPKSARGHLHGISKASRLASRAAAANADDFGFFLARCAFDGFSAVLFGEMMHTADLSKAPDPRNIQLMQDVAALNRALLEPGITGLWSASVAQCTGYQTAWFKQQLRRYRSVESHLDAAVNAFIEQMEQGTLDEHQQHSYLMRALDRQVEGGVMSAHTVKGMVQMLLAVSNDTTSTLLTIAVLFLALHPEVQTRLSKEMLEHVGHGGIQVEMLTGTNPGLQYLDAVLRECHRLRPGIGPVVHFKRPVEDVQVHGYTIPKDTLTVFDLHSVQNDPDIVGPDAASFRPERWLPDAVATRKGTDAELLDHALLAKPFSSGARMCPAARVANLEVQCIVAHLVMDWKFELADKSVTSISQLRATAFLPGAIDSFPRFSITPRAA